MRKGREMDEGRIVKESIVKRLNSAAENPLYAIRDCIVELAEHIDKINNIRIVKEYVWEKITVQEMKFMRRFGWEVSRVDGMMVKRDLTTGKVLAHEGDETWDRDLKVAGE